MSRRNLAVNPPDLVDDIALDGETKVTVKPDLNPVPYGKDGLEITPGIQCVPFEKRLDNHRGSSLPGAYIYRLKVPRPASVTTQWSPPSLRNVPSGITQSDLRDPITKQPLHPERTLTNGDIFCVKNGKFTLNYMDEKLHAPRTMRVVGKDKNYVKIEICGEFMTSNGQLPGPSFYKYQYRFEMAVQVPAHEVISRDWIPRSQLDTVPNDI
ncbi:unnamed protein product [Mycena citricolor]|uniref:Uncharacterized protein n=1 Tax=Mycena citricolor TaxID=2018698 RepID=A0AAD2HRQ3_9AGAR|nr:unnamed protein product [Mycena citricolor]